MIRRYGGAPRISSSFLLASVLLGTFIEQAEGPQTPPEPDPGERARLAEDYLRNSLIRWQGRLKLHDWAISIVMSRPSDLRPGTTGNIRWDADRKTARIRVLDAASYQRPFRAMLEDMEFTVVHELIHLQLSSLPRSEASRSDEEHAVNRITDALLKLDRAGSEILPFPLAARALSQGTR